jgi:hypothetical protein
LRGRAEDEEATRGRVNVEATVRALVVADGEGGGHCAGGLAQTDGRDVLDAVLLIAGGDESAFLDRCDVLPRRPCARSSSCSWLIGVQLLSDPP